jgi:putative acetyltransferase
VGGDEVIELFNAQSAVGAKELCDESLAPTKGAGIDDEPCDVPVDRANTDIFEVGPDQPAVRAEKVPYRPVAMDCLGGERALEDRGCQRLEARTQEISVLGGEPRRRTQLGRKPVEPVAHVAELSELAREVGERGVEIAERPSEIVGGRQRPGRIVLDKLPEGHPETLILVGPRREDVAWWNGKTPFSQKDPDGDLASKPALDVSVELSGAGHHSCNHPGGFEMDKHIAAGSHHNRVVAGDGMGQSNRPGRRQGTCDSGVLSHVEHDARKSVRRSNGTCDARICPTGVRVGCVEMLIRRYQAGDRETVSHIHADAFRQPGERGTPIEVGVLHDLIDMNDVIDPLSLVAELDGTPVGHVICSRATVADHGVAALGPIAVLPHRQRRGIGLAMLHSALAAADALGYPLMALLGSISYYSSFGVVPASGLGIDAPEPTWGDNFQVRPLSAYRPEIRGQFRYAPAFDGL